MFRSAFDHSRPLEAVRDAKMNEIRSQIFGFLSIFAPFLPLEPSFDCMKVSGVVPEQFPGSFECFRVHLTIVGPPAVV